MLDQSSVHCCSNLQVCLALESSTPDGCSVPVSKITLCALVYCLPPPAVHPARAAGARGHAASVQRPAEGAVWAGAVHSVGRGVQYGRGSCRFSIACWQCAHAALADALAAPSCSPCLHPVCRYLAARAALPGAVRQDATGTGPRQPSGHVQPASLAGHIGSGVGSGGGDGRLLPETEAQGGAVEAAILARVAAVCSGFGGSGSSSDSRQHGALPQ
jgi:hypothetical protein